MRVICVGVDVALSRPTNIAAVNADLRGWSCFRRPGDR